MLLLFSFLHSVLILGRMNAIIFFLVSITVSWFFEQIGVMTGAIFGDYFYTQMLPDKLGSVPFFIPLAWFMMIYLSFIFSFQLLFGLIIRKKTLFMKLALAMGTAIIMTAWDLVMDPVLSGKVVNMWVWVKPGEYFGVPFHNFIGWLAVSFIIIMTYFQFEKEKLINTTVPKSIVYLALIAYFFNTVFFSKIEKFQEIGLLINISFIFFWIFISHRRLSSSC